MTKKRVYDLAKQYGMSGQDLAAKLRDLGFEKIKSHMTALTEFEVMEVQGRLEAYGIVGESSPDSAAGSSGGLVIRRKRKKKTADTPSEQPAQDAEGAPAPEAAPAESQEPAGQPTSAEAPAETAGSETEPEPSQVAARATSAGGTTAASAPASPADAQQPDAVEADTITPVAKADSGAAQASADADVAAPEQEAAAGIETKAAETAERAQAQTDSSSATEEVQPESADAAAEQAKSETTDQAAVEATDSASDQELAAEAASKAEPAAPEGEQAAGAESPAETDEAAAKAKPGKTGKKGKQDDDGESVARDKDGNPVVRPASMRRQGKVVGFIDLSKIQPRETAPKRQSRRLSSSDDVAPDVQPTMGRDRKSALQRGDHGARGELTAAQLREREAARFLRRRGPGGGTGSRGRGGGRGGAPRRASAAGGSPHSGGQVLIEEPITTKKLAEALSVKSNMLLMTAMRGGLPIASINALLDEDTAVLLAEEFDVELKVSKRIEAEERLLTELAENRDAIEDEHITQRPPCVAVLGHVDHGKTTLIDTIRKTRLVNAEAGGITQHIGAYQVQTQQGHTLTIIDTPGHAAFTGMRARGAKAVDVVVIVIAADDGIKPQTEEAIQHARAAGAPIVVALNKIDKPEAEAAKVMQQLPAIGLNPEEWGGEIAVMSISALKGDGVEDLLERVFLESEVLELKCHSDGPASGVVLEAEIQKGKGRVAHLLVQDGQLNQGDVILAGQGYGKVRSIHDDRGKSIKFAGPSKPVEVTGLNELPNVGDQFHVVESLIRAKEVASERSHKDRMVSLAGRREISAANLFEAVAEQEKNTINVIVRADNQGSVEVLRQQLSELAHEEVEVKVILSGVGEVVESDIDLAATSDATLIAFHVGTNSKARKAAERQNVPILNYSVIYELLDWVRTAMERTLSPEFNEEITGHAEIKRVFPSSRFGNIAGCQVLDGTIKRDSLCRLLRDGTVVHTGSISGLRREKDDAKEVREGFECGILIKNYNDIRADDIIEGYKMVETRRILEI